MANDNNRDELQVEFRRELERIGVPKSEARQLAQRSFESTDFGARTICQHVVPVSRGWIVVRDFPNQDLGLFATKEEALRDAKSLAEASGVTVRVHDEAE